MRRFLLPLYLLLCVGRTVSAQTETIEYYGQDAIGSIRIVFDANGTIVARQDYAPFGRALFQVPSMPRLGFGGQEHDAETQSVYFHARILSPGVGRFFRTDPLFEGQEHPERWNRYSYALNSPLRYQDPTGMSTKATDPFGYDCKVILSKNKKDQICYAGPPMSPFPQTNPTSPTENVRNGSRNPIMVKRGNEKPGDKPVEVKPGEEFKEDSDGVAVPCLRPGEVFKNVNGTDVVVTDTSVTTDAGWNPISAVVQIIRGGWQGASFRAARRQFNDWEELFKASEAKAQCK